MEPQESEFEEYERMVSDLSRLNFSSDVQFHPHGASFNSFSDALADGAPPPPGSDQQHQHPLSWASMSRLLPLSWASSDHQHERRLTISPNVNESSYAFSGSCGETWGRAPYLHEVHRFQNQSRNYFHRYYFYDATTTNHNNTNLHGNEFFPRTVSFRNNNSDYIEQLLNQRLTPESMIGRITSLAMNRVWSSVLMLKLDEEMSEEDIEMILHEVMGFLGDLLMNHYGNKFVQKLFTMCDEDQKTRVIMALTNSPSMFIFICLNSCGARAVQKLLEKLYTPQQISMVVASLVLGASDLATDSNGQHIIDFCVKNFHGEHTRYLIDEISKNCLRIGTDKSGCFVIQACVENYRGETRERLIGEIIKNVMELSQDRYGSSGLKRPQVTRYLVRLFKGNFVSLSCDKYASNVVEKLLQSDEESSATIIVDLLIRNPNNASMLLIDPFGNYVVQTALNNSKGRAHELLVRFIKTNTQPMRNNLYGKKILDWFDHKKKRRRAS